SSSAGGLPGARSGSRADAVDAGEALERLRHGDRAVGALVVLEQRDQRARDGDGGAVQQVQVLALLRALALEAGVESARLVVAAVRGARDLAPAAALAAARHPGLEVELADRRRAEVAGRDVEHAIGDLERLEEALLDRQQRR